VGIVAEAWSFDAKAKFRRPNTGLWYSKNFKQFSGSWEWREMEDNLTGEQGVPVNFFCCSACIPSLPVSVFQESHWITVT
jgi:hypothetical protein